MRRTLLLTLGFALIMAAFDTSTFGQQTKVRTWTSKSGSEVKARFAGMDGKAVILEKKGGARLKIHIGQLSEEDQALARKQAEAMAPGERKPNQLPVFQSGPHQNYFYVFEMRNMQALVNNEGGVVVYPKQGTKRLDRPMTVGWYIQFRMRGRPPSQRPVVSFDEFPEPGVRKMDGEVSVQGKAKDDVAFTLTYKYERGSFSILADLDDPSDIEHPSRIIMGYKIPPSHKIPRTMPLSERRKLVEGLALAVRYDKKKEEYNYFDSLHIDTTHAEYFEMKNVWDRLTVRVEPAKGGGLRLINYSGQPLWKGLHGYESISEKSGEQGITFSVTR